MAWPPSWTWTCSTVIFCCPLAPVAVEGLQKACIGTREPVGLGEVELADFERLLQYHRAHLNFTAVGQE